jgi:hypothetical protein
MQYADSSPVWRAQVNAVAQFVLFGLVGFSLIAATPAEAQVSLDALLKDCEKKTIVMGRDEKGGIVQVGENISGYCRGVLEGMFAVLVRAKAICVKERNASPDFLLSALLTYRKQTKSLDNDAASVVEAALKRAFSCTN